ncbi:alpha-L-rhamnosidase [Streptomyces formicae]|uniref:alpha-L-rhamnosidase n=1 Tax=Streptomyces formicae TaxID=1616117 RepID=A0ABY3WQ64_9ACTN|nr:alpha-L-rhamnosidase [Streptomyces formicae]UNM12927.1 family 78 glycoside hydrolase catalytic domain [Streptomyces formicae]
MTAGTTTAPTALRVAHLAEPLGIDDEHPDLSWKLSAGRQDSYQIHVATNPDLLAAGVPDLWDSGRVAGHRGVGVEYGGKALGSAQRAHWRVRVWDEQGTASEWSATASWETGLLLPSDWAGAQWVTAPEWASPDTHDPAAPLPLLARDFHLDRPVRRARIHATALGVYEASVNGARVSDAVLEPGCTAYDKRLLYATYDITDALRQGANTLGILLGNGIANVPDVPGRYEKLHLSYGLPRALAVLLVEHTDGTCTRLVTDGAWRTAPGPITLSAWFGGEEHDARREPGPSDWRPAVPVTAHAPDVTLSARMHPPVEVVETVDSVSVAEPRPGVYVFDLGVNIAGWPELRVSGPAGTSVIMRPAELLHDDGTVNQRFTGRQCYDRYTLRGTDTGAETWHPRTVYHGFRYVQVEGLPGPPAPDTVRGLVLRAANAPAGGFSCSDDLLDSIHRLVDRAVQGNMYSILTDCPHREKLGWLEQTHLVFPAVARNYDVAAYYRKLVRDMADAQTDTGLVPGIAPEYKVFEDKFRSDPNWGGAIVLAPWHLYRTYGDTATLRAHYPSMLRYLDHLASRTDGGGLLTHGLGDWIAFDDSTPKGVTAAFAHHRIATAMSEIAQAIGESADARRHAALADRIGRAFHDTYFDADRHTYATGSQAADALALDLGIVPDAERGAVLDHLIASVRAAGDHVTVGEVALPSLLRVLSAYGRDDVVWDLVSRTDSPSYGYQVTHGATALTERWDGPTRGSSQNHLMLGAIEEWFGGALAGIRQAEDSVAFDRIVVRPTPVGDLSRVSAWYDTPRGRVCSAWERTDDGLRFDITVPPGTPSRIELPVPAGAAAPRAPRGARPLGTAGGRVGYEVGHGTWQFSVGA